MSRLLFNDPDRAVLKGLGHAGVIAPVLRMVKASHRAMSSSYVVVNPRLAGVTTVHEELHDAAALRARVFERLSVPASWQYTSYTSLTNDWVRSGRIPMER